MKKRLQNMLFGTLEDLVQILEQKFGEEFKKLPVWEKYEVAMRFYNSQKTMLQQYKFLLDVLPWVIALVALLKR
ncbi:MAG: hypothetical protein WC575_03445 [Patescibacteria group bacterium]